MRAAAWGVDLTGGAVRAVHVERAGRRYRVLDVVDQPTSASGEGAEPISAHLQETVGRGLTDLVLRRRGALDDAIFVALPVFGAKCGGVEVPIADPEQARAMLDLELHRAIADELDPWQVRTTPPRRTAEGFACDYFAQRRTLIASFVADLRRFGLPIDGLVPGPLALARFGEAEWPQKGRRLLIECHRTRTDLLYLSHDGSRRWRSLPFGCGTLADVPVGSPARERDADRLALQIAREQNDARGAFFGVHDGTAPERIVLLGEAARHEELRRALETALSAPVVTPHVPRDFVVAPAAAPRLPFHMGTALGLAMAALDAAPAHESLIVPPRSRIALRALPAWVAALLLLVVSLLATRTLALQEERALVAARDAARQATDFGSHEEWVRARDAAQAAAGRSAALLDAIGTAQRRAGALDRLLAALSLEEAFFRLVECRLLPGDPADGALLVLEVENGLPGAANGIGELLRSRAGIAVIGVEETALENGTLRLRLRVALPAEAGP